MAKSRVLYVLTACAVFSLGTAMMTAQRGDASTPGAPSGRDFPVPGANLYNQRYSSLRQITPANVSRLGGAWMVHVADGMPGNMQATPIVVDGVMYVSAEAGGGVIAV